MPFNICDACQRRSRRLLFGRLPHYVPRVACLLALLQMSGVLFQRRSVENKEVLTGT